MSILYQVAINQGIVKENNYFLLSYPNGNNCLFRLVKREERYVMWGPPTKEKIWSYGKRGYKNFFTLADAQVNKEYSLSEMLEEVHALRLPKKKYKFTNYEVLRKFLKDVQPMFDHADDKEMDYALASLCESSGYDGNYFSVFHVNSGSVNWACLHHSFGEEYHYADVVRPEAIPKSTLILETEGCDGSKEHPWICLGSQEGMQDTQSKT